MDACSKNPLFFADNRIGVDGVKAMATMLASNESLTSIDLKCNETLLFIFSFFLFFKTLFFQLAANPMGDGGAIALADALAHNNALAEINLNSQRGLFVFSLFLKKKSNFAGCKIGGSGGEALCQAFKINRSTTKIDLAGTCVVVRPKEESAV